MRSVAFDDRIERSNYHGMVERPESLQLGLETTARRFIPRRSRAEQLHHDARQELIVGGQVSLVTLASSEEAQRVPTGVDLVPGGEAPRGFGDTL